MRDFITVKVKNQAKIQFNDLSIFDNEQLIATMNDFFKINSVTKVVDKLNKLSMNSYDREPTVNSFTKYSKAFSLAYNEVDIRFRPSVKSTIACYLIGLHPYSFRMKVKNEDPKTLEAADDLARKEVQSLNESNDKLNQYNRKSDNRNYNSNSYYNKRYHDNSRDNRDKDRERDKRSSNYHSDRQQHQQHRDKPSYNSTNYNNYNSKNNYNYPENRARGTESNRSEVSGESLKNKDFSKNFSRESSRDRSPSMDRRYSKAWPRNQDFRDRSHSPGSQDSSRSHRSHSSDYNDRDKSRERSGSSEKLHFLQKRYHLQILKTDRLRRQQTLSHRSVQDPSLLSK